MGRADREIDENSYLFVDIKFKSVDDIINKRFEVCFKWYVRKACFYKLVYFIASFFSVICPLITTALNGIFLYDKRVDVQVASIILSVVTGVSASVLNITRAQEKWISYRGVAEFLKRVRAEYLVKIRKIDKHIQENEGKEEAQKEREAWKKLRIEVSEQYFKKMEDYMEKEHRDWEKLNLKERKAKRKEKNKKVKTESTDSDTKEES